MRVLMMVLFLPTFLYAQRMRVTMPHDTGTAVRALYITPNDTATLQVRAWNAAGAQVTARSAGISGWARWPCMQLAKRDTFGLMLQLRVTERANCTGKIIGTAALTMDLTVGGRAMRDTIIVSRPPRPPAGTDLSICGTAIPAQLFYTAPDTGIAFAIRGAGPDRIALGANDPAEMSAFPWQGATITFQYYAIACARGWRAWDVTSVARWATDDTTIAVVSRGVVTWKRPAPYALLVQYP